MAFFPSNESSINFRPLISDEITKDIVYVMLIGVGSCVSFFGVMANALNVAVYVKQGINESITVQFMFLSISDLFVCILAFAISLLYLFTIIQSDITPLDPGSLLYLLDQSKEKMYSMSVLVTIVISIERCLCVALPFQVKSAFTKSRSVKIVIFIAIFGVAFLIPEYLTGGLAWQYDPRFRRYRLLLWQTERALIEIVKDIVLSGVLLVLAGITTTLCAVFLVSAVKASRKFRSSEISGKGGNSSRHSSTKVTKGKHMPPKGGMSRKEARQTKTVICIDTIFIVCSIPEYFVVAMSVVKNIMPEFRLFPATEYTNIILVVNVVAFMCEAINCAMNFIVYYVTSTRFRTALREICIKK